MTFKFIFVLPIFVFTSLLLLNSANAQDEVFDTLELDGGGGSATLRFDGGDDGTDRYTLFGRSSGTSLDLDGPGGFNVLRFHDDAPSGALAINGNGIGIGIDNETDITAGMALRSDDFSSYPNIRLSIANRESTTASREQFRLINNGPVRFGLQDTSLGSQWSFVTTANDQFQIRKNGPGTTNMAMRPNGSIAFGFAGFTNFTMLGNGNAVLRGTLQENSDRNAKKNIISVDPEMVLTKVAELPISTWSYKHDEGVTHLGPMAQDFRASFGLGMNETSICTVDTSGVALAAIKGLNNVVEENKSAKDKQIENLNEELNNANQQINAMSERMARMEEMLETLATQQ